MDFKALKAPEKESKSLSAVVKIAGKEAQVTFDFDTSSARMTKTGKEYFLNVSGNTSHVVDGTKCILRFQGNLFIRPE